MSGLTLDAGALIAFERNDRPTVLLLWNALRTKTPLAVPAGVVAQVWRDGQRQARLAKLLSARTLEVEPLDDFRAREAGQMCGVSSTADIVDASVVLCARRRKQKVITCDADPALELLEI